MSEHWSGGIYTGFVVTACGKSELGILLVKEPRTKWSLPGGYQEEKETPEATATREILEESGYCVKLGKVLKQMQEFAKGGISYMRYVYAIESGEKNTQNENARFFPLRALPKVKRRHKEILNSVFKIYFRELKKQKQRRRNQQKNRQECHQQPLPA